MHTRPSLLVLCLLILVTTNANASYWTWANPLPKGGSFYSLAKGSTGYVAVGNAGNIYFSTDGKTWAPEPSPTTAPMMAVSYGNGRYIAVGEFDTIITSADGKTWTEDNVQQEPLQSGFIPPTLYCITYGGGIWLAAGGYDSTVYRSLDGITWTKETPLSSSAGSDVKQILYTNSQFVLLGEGSLSASIWTSSDGLSWTPITSTRTIFTNDFPNVLGWNGSTYVIIGADPFSSGSTPIATSPDAVNWILQKPITGIGNRVFTSIATDSTNQFVALLQDDNLNEESIEIAHSADGISWTTSSTDIPYSQTSWFSGPLVIDNGSYLTVGASLAVFSTSNGTNWASERPVSGFEDTIRGMTVGTDKAVAVGDSGLTVFSEDGTSWKTSTSGITDMLDAVTTNGSLYVAVGEHGRIITSPDGITWTIRNSTLPTSTTLEAVTHNGSSFVAVGRNGIVITSQDGIKWTAETSGTTADINSIVWTGSHFVGVLAYNSQNYNFITSTDGTQWTTASLPTPTTGGIYNLSEIYWTGTEGLAVGKHEDSSGNIFATVLTSADGINWSSQDVTSAQTFSSIVSVNGTIVASSDDTSYTSSDGTTWTSVENNLPTMLGMASWDSRIFAFGSAGMILYNGPAPSISAGSTSGNTGGSGSSGGSTTTSSGTSSAGGGGSLGSISCLILILVILTRPFIRDTGRFTWVGSVKIILECVDLHPKSTRNLHGKLIHTAIAETAECMAKSY